jgi:hypothetical protein
MHSDQDTKRNKTNAVAILTIEILVIPTKIGTRSTNLIKIIRSLLC